MPLLDVQSDDQAIPVVESVYPTLHHGEIISVAGAVGDASFIAQAQGHTGLAGCTIFRFMPEESQRPGRVDSILDAQAIERAAQPGSRGAMRRQFPVDIRRANGRSACYRVAALYNVDT